MVNLRIFLSLSELNFLDKSFRGMIRRYQQKMQNAIVHGTNGTLTEHALSAGEMYGSHGDPIKLFVQCAQTLVDI